MPPRPLLYTYRRCPYAMRARMALLEAGIAFDAIEISLRQKPAEMLALSPKGTVPVLALPGGEVLEQSLDIMRWALQAPASEGDDLRDLWLRAQSADNLALLQQNDTQFKHHLDRYKYPERFPETHREASRSAALNCLILPLETRLQDEPFLGGTKACAADWAIFPFVRQFRAVDAAWFDAQAMPAVQRWLSLWLLSPLFERCMRKMPEGVRTAF
jgi:glutathione S-transferase